MALSFVDLEMELVAAAPSPRQPAQAADHAGFFCLIWQIETDLGRRCAWVVEACEIEIAFGIEADAAGARRQIAAVIYRCAGAGSVMMH